MLDGANYENGAARSAQELPIFGCRSFANKGISLCSGGTANFICCNFYPAEQKYHNWKKLSKVMSLFLFLGQEDETKCETNYQFQREAAKVNFDLIDHC